jgi:Putative Ig domain
MRNHLPGTGLAAIALGLGTLIGPGPATATQVPGAGGRCGAFPGAHPLPGAEGVVPAAWSGALTATDGRPPYRWRVTSGALPAGLALSAAGVLSGMARAEAAAEAPTGRWPITVAVTDTSGATATAGLSLSVAETAAAGATGDLRYAEWAWHHPDDEGWQPPVKRRAPQN